MKSRIEDVRFLDDLRYRAWNGAIVDVWTVECGPAARGETGLQYHVGVKYKPELFDGLATTSFSHQTVQRQRSSNR
ncbi:hypothetical protein AAIB41_12600 [Brucella sp. BE17]|uniref:hypothetical protein n=1 Tax=Brucella sp. BE17 TaxID=3142977 RepID=UPI0031BA2339